MDSIDDPSQAIERVLGYVVKHETMIRASHNHLGIPLEDLLCAAVRKALSTRAIDCDQQLDLFGEKNEPDNKKGRK